MIVDPIINTIRLDDTVSRHNNNNDK